MMQDLSANILQGVSNYDASAYLAHAERTLEIIKSHNFTADSDATSEELAMAENGECKSLK